MRDTMRPATPVALGELLTPDVIRARYFAAVQPPPSLRWIAAQMPRHLRVRVGCRDAWWSADVERALAEMRGAA